MLKRLIGRPTLPRSLTSPSLRSLSLARPSLLQRQQHQPTSGHPPHPKQPPRAAPSAKMISPPPSAHPRATVSKAELVSPTTIEAPPPDLTDAQLRQPTTELYEDPHPYTREELARPETHGGPYAVARAKLDYAYHKKPTLQRRQLQDQIVDLVMNESHAVECRNCYPASSGSSNSASGRQSPVNDSNDQTLENGRSRHRRPKKPVALFTSGGMGAGKGHVLRQFLEDGTLKLEENFVWIDPDKISRILPERPLYLASNPENSATLLHPESSLLQELLTHAAREQHRSVVIDGSLSCSDWFRDVMHEFRDEGYMVEVLFVFCTDEDTMWARAERRRVKTGRRVSREQIHRSRMSSPASVQALSSPSASSHQAPIDRLRLVDNSSDKPAVHPRIVYDSRDDSSWKEGVGGEVDVVRIALGEEAARKERAAYEEGEERTEQQLEKARM